jgi:hypothetical protein
MATTTNYGWTTPDDTALVKDGAAAIRTLGTSIDTTTKNLNPSTTLGDIEYRSSTSNTNTRLGIGSTGNVLTVAGGVPTWAAPAGGINYQLLSTTTLSGAATRTVSGISGINSLYIYISNASSASASSDFNLRLNTDSGSNYKFFGLSLRNNADVVYRVDSSSSTSVTLANIGNADGTANILIKIDGTNAAGVKAINVSGAGTDTNGESRVLNGIYTGTSAISSVSLISSVGNFDGGTMYVYGG